jgi:ketosteroid isomerase-like protein
MKPKSWELKGQMIAVTLVCCVAASPRATEPTPPQTASPPDARQQLFGLDKEWAAAERRRDGAALRRILDERFVATLGSKTYDREAFIQLFTGDVDPTASEILTYEAVIIDGDTAVLVGTDTARGTRAGAAYTATYRYTTTYIRRHEQWRALVEHIVKVPEAT